MPVVSEAKARARSLSIEAPVIIANIYLEDRPCQRLLRIDPAAKLFHNICCGGGKMRERFDEACVAAGSGGAIFAGAIAMLCAANAPALDNPAGTAPAATAPQRQPQRLRLPQPLRPAHPRQPPPRAGSARGPSTRVSSVLQPGQWVVLPPVQPAASASRKRRRALAASRRFAMPHAPPPRQSRRRPRQSRRPLRRVPLRQRCRPVARR